MKLTPICALLALVAGCRAEARPADAEPASTVERRDILVTVPRIGRSIVTDTTGADDAQKLVLYAQVPFDSVLRFYRARLPAEAWHIMSDEGDSVNTVIRAQREDMLLWVQVRRVGNLATEYTLIAGVEPTDRPGPEMARP